VPSSGAIEPLPLHADDPLAELFRGLDLDVAELRAARFEHLRHRGERIDLVLAAVERGLPSCSYQTPPVSRRMTSPT
jgi:hypothetical protein